MSGPQAYVKLAPEFGGTAFPPMEGPELRIGSSDDNHVKVHESLGVEAQHVRLVRKSPDTFYLAPVERSAAVWLYRSGQRDPASVTGPTVITAGDSFALATPQGVRFILMLKDVDRRKKSAGPAERPPELTDAQKAAERMQRGLVAEVWRRTRAAVLTTWFGRMIQTSWYFIKTRQFLSPVYIIGFVMMLSGWIGVSFQMGKTRSVTKEKEDANTALQECKNNLAAMGEMGKGGKIPFDELTATILGDPTWKGSLAWAEMHQAMAREITAIFRDKDNPHQNAMRERWFLEKDSPYVTAYNALTAASVDPDLAQILAWTVVSNKEPELARSKEEGHERELWDMNSIASPEYHLCQRGLFRLTWRQAHTLGLTVADEATIPAAIESQFQGADVDAKKQGLYAAFNTTRRLANLDLLPETFRDSLSMALVSHAEFAEGQCFGMVTPDDERNAAAIVAKAIQARVGVGKPGLPEKGNSNWISGRVAMLFALDLKLNRHEAVTVSSSALGGAFNGIKDDPEGYAMIAQRTGETLGRALASPCAIVMDKREGKLPPPFKKVPPTDYCAILIARAQFNQLGE